MREKHGMVLLGVNVHGKISVCVYGGNQMST